MWPTPGWGWKRRAHFLGNQRDKQGQRRWWRWNRLLLLLLVVAFIWFCSPFLSRLTALTCDSSLHGWLVSALCFVACVTVYDTSEFNLHFVCCQFSAVCIRCQGWSHNDVGQPCQQEVWVEGMATVTVDPLMTAHACTHTWQSLLEFIHVDLWRVDRF